MEAARLTLDQSVEIREEKGRLVIEPVRGPEYRLEDLVDGITHDNCHDETDTGAPVGREAG